MEVRVGPAVIVTHVDDEVLVSEPNGDLSSGAQQGYFIADTRLVSGYRLKIGRVAPILLNSSSIRAHSARFEFTNPLLLDDEGNEVPEESLHLRLDRVLGRGLHEDYDLTNYSRNVVDVVLEISLESDFADLFDVRNRRLQRRGIVQSLWDVDRTALTNEFHHDLFRRSIIFEAITLGHQPSYANGGLIFPLRLDPGATWHACLIWRPVLDNGPEATIQACHELLDETETLSDAERWIAGATRFTTSDPEITATIGQAVDDLVALRMRAYAWPTTIDDVGTEVAPVTGTEVAPVTGTEVAPVTGTGVAPVTGTGVAPVTGTGVAPVTGTEVAPVTGTEVAPVTGTEVDDSWTPAAGVPWFVTLFGRDALTTSLESASASYKFAEGSLRALAARQATGVDDERDMQPGKIEHELRRGELAHLHLIPHTPYYGSHDATPLFVLTAATWWRWRGDKAGLDRLRPNVEAALAWVDRDGDLDGDGLQEYKTRSKQGYPNQGWKDAFDGILHADGSAPELPIATCELQGLVVAAKRAWSEVLERTYGEQSDARRLRDEAARLSEAIEERFFWEDEGTYYLGLDGKKQPIESVASNPGHLLYYDAVVDERARLVARRLLADDLWSGWGVRTLSSEHQAYNPFSYQLGSVWPHDNAIIAAGFRRYGLDFEAQMIARALFDAAACLANRRLPELFSGLQRDVASFPVQYLGANVPQAWASGAIIQLLDTLIGLQPDATAGQLAIRPALPSWLEEVTLSGLAIGSSRLDVTVRRDVLGRHQLEVMPLDAAVRVVLQAATI